MKPNRFSTGCAAVLAAVCTLFFAGCSASGQTGSSTALPQSSAAPNAAVSAWQDDGKLRLLYGSGYGGTMAFRGVTPLGGGSEALWLLNDATTNEYTHYATNTPQEGQPHQYRVYDSTGTLVYYCGAEEPRFLLGDWLVLSEAYDGPDVNLNAACRMVHLKTGESRPVPDAMSMVETLPDGNYLLSGWNAEGVSSCAIYTPAWEQLVHFENAELYRLYHFDSCGWLELNQHSWDEFGYRFEQSLYHPATGTELPGYDGLVGNGVACLHDGRGNYTLYDLAAQTELARGGQRYLLYHAGILMTEERDGRTLRDNDGNVYLVEDSAIAKDGTLVVRSKNYAAAYVYDGSGKLLYTVKNAGGNRLEALPGGRFVATVYNWEYPERSSSTLYGPEGVIFRTEKGSSISRYTDAYLVVERCSYAGSLRYDLYDYEGNLLIESLAGIPGTPEETILPARRGYTVGWMDLEGNWLWSRRMFSTVEDEKDYSWY